MFGFGQRHETRYDGTMRLAFCRDGSWEPTGVALTQDAEGRLHGDGDPAAQAQVERMLSLDVDGRGFADVGRRDPVIGRLQAAAPGLRPPLFMSAYEAAAWCVLSARRPARQMQAVRNRMSAEHGTTFSLAGEEITCFPKPDSLLGVRQVAGLTTEKISRLHAVAQAALDGRLDTAALRALAPAEATAQLQQLPGIGPFSASLVVVRALGHTDVLPEREPRAQALVGELYGLDRPASVGELARVAAVWSPFRTWSLVLLRAAAHRLRPAPIGTEPW